MVATAAMSPSTFFSALPVALAGRLPAELRAFEHKRGFGRLMKFDYGDPGVHYEAWHHTATGRMEVGLHLEGPAAANEAGFRLLRGRLVEIRHLLPHAELEPWDKGWYRLYETFRAPVLSPEVLEGTAARLAAYITALHPILESEGGVPPRVGRAQPFPPPAPLGGR
ncbi:MAG TPA: hypothetical protein VF160_14650 [Candidatus Dormibacteraeota bacterium]